jgi:hypothetical protein
VIKILKQLLQSFRRAQTAMDFCVVANPKLKKQIRIAAEEEEKNKL